MANTKLRTTLKNAWTKAVKAEKIISTVKTKNNGTFQFGVKMIKNKPSYFAYNTTQDRPIKAEIKEKKIAGTDFVIQLNEFRALRPGGDRPNVGRQQNISPLPARCKFYCKNPKNTLSLATRIILAKSSEPKYNWNFYYNAFPFEASGHFMILPATKAKKSILPHLPQKLTPVLVKDLISLFKKSDGLVHVYQSLHAGATVNHFHLHSFFHARKFAMQNAKVILNKLVDYPADAFVYSLKAEEGVIWKAINILQQHEIPFDLVNMKGKVYIFPRHPQHEVVSEFPDGGIGVNELMGLFVTSSPTTYRKFTKRKLMKALEKTCLEI